MYRRPKFLEILYQIRQEMSREADYDLDLFAQMVRNEKLPVTDCEISNDGEIVLAKSANAGGEDGPPFDK